MDINMNFYYYVYIHTRTDKNEIFYVGVGTVYKNCRKSSKLATRFTRAYDKGGRNNFWKNIVSKTNYKIDIIFQSEIVEDVLEREKEYIKLYGRRDIGLGTLVNLTDGGDRETGHIVSQETRNKISNTTKGKFNGKYGVENANIKKCYMYDLDGNYIKTFDAVFQAMEEIGLKNIRRSFKGQRCKNGVYYAKGYQFTYSYVGEKIDKYEKLSYLNKFYKPIEIFKDGILIEKFSSIKEASLYMGGNYDSNRSGITRCLHGSGKTVKGYSFKLIN